MEVSMKMKLLSWKRTRDLQKELCKAFAWEESKRGGEYWNNVIMALGDELYKMEVTLLTSLRRAGYEVNEDADQRQAVSEVYNQMVGEPTF